MALLVTDALVLHAFDYLESSRILRLVTREAGLVSVLAKGSRRSRSRFGSALDLFAEGSAQMYVKPGRDLHTLSSFDVARSRPAIGEDLGRFTGAAAIAELVLRFASEEGSPVLYDTILRALDELAAAPSPRTREAALGGAWRLVTELGFAPSLESCSRCHSPIERSGPVMFSHPAGGLVCGRCARLEPAGRVLPAGAREALSAWIEGREATDVDEAAGRAHQRLLREFLREHLADGRPLRAFEVWEHERWS